MKRFNVTAQAKPRVYNGHQFDNYWCAGYHWTGLEPRTRELDEKELAEVRRESENGYPIRLIRVEEIKVPDASFIPAPQPEKVKTSQPGKVKAPWET